MLEISLIWFSVSVLHFIALGQPNIGEQTTPCKRCHKNIPCKQPAANDLFKTISCKRFSANDPLQTTSCKRLPANDPLKTTSCKQSPRTTSLQTIPCKQPLQTTSCKDPWKRSPANDLQLTTLKNKT